MPEEPPRDETASHRTPTPPSTPRPPRKRSPRPTLSGVKKPRLAEAQRLLWKDPEHRAKMSAARQRTAEARRRNPNKYSRVGVPDGMRKAEAMEAWAQARAGADDYIATLAAKGVVASTTVPDTDEAMATACLHELAKIALGPGSPRTRLLAARSLLAYTKVLPEVRREIGITAEGLLAQVLATTHQANSTENGNDEAH